MKKLIFYVLFIFCVQNSFGQLTGCNDKFANNYDSLVTQNDGSCTYDTIIYNPTVVVDTLDKALDETSGLVFFNGTLWSHNDSGGKPEIYQIDTITGKVLRKIIVDNISNVDWEELAQDSLFVYIGDFGNNKGNRTDLKVFKISKKDILEKDTVTCQKIKFSYPEQTDFSSQSYNHNFDCEAMICYKDSIYLFTKNWANKKTSLYQLPKTAGTYSANFIDSFNVDGLITGADIDTVNNAVVLLGYRGFYAPFFWLLYDFETSNVFSGNNRKIFTDAGDLGQTEGIALIDSGYYFISNEAGSNPGKLRKLPTLQWLIYPEPPQDTTELGLKNYFSNPAKPYKFYPNPAQNSTNIEFLTHFDSAKVQIYNSTGKLINTKNLSSTEVRTRVLFKNKGVYFVKIEIDGRWYSDSIICY